MTTFQGALWAQLALAVLAVLAAVLAGDRRRNLAAGLVTAGLGVAGCVTGAVALTGAGDALRVDTALPGLALGVAGTPLGGLFTLLAGVVATVASVYGIGYAHGAAASCTAWSAYAAFVLGLQLVPVAADAITFLLAWEVMAVGSTVLVLAEHRLRPTVRRAGLWYAVMTHLSFLFVAAGLGILTERAGDTSFAAMAEAPASGTGASVAFVLLVLGFGAKAGVVPLHVWLPRAHPEAPSHVSALMSAVMVKMGVFGIVLTTTTLLPDGPTWWALLLLALALPSAVYGILHAAVASDLKRLLAYSTTENVGLILAAVGLAQLTRDTAGGVAATAMSAALLLTISHAAFKAVLFLAAGSILHATGERDLDRLGGLARQMPVTTIAFGVGALGAAALPVTGGFIAEWVLLQSLIHADARTDRLTTALLPAVMGVVALTAGLALLTFTKAFGIAALARPRSVGAQLAHEGPASMRLALLAMAAAVIGLGVAPGATAGVVDRIIPGALASHGVAGLSLPTVDASLDPIALALLGVVLSAPILVVVVVLAMRVPRVHVDLGWGCGGVRTSPRMQYTATSYAEPLVRVFGDALSPTRDLQVTRAGESAYVIEAMSFTQRVSDVVENRLYRPVVRLLKALGDLARRVQNGSIHRYVGFSFAALVAVLVGVLR